jgi:hypothetical protein
VLAVEPRADALLEGRERTEDPREMAALSWVCHRRGAFRAEAEWLDRSFAASGPVAGETQPWFRGAVAALRATAGEGTDAADLDDGGRARLRSWALAWLREELRAGGAHPPEYVHRFRLYLRQSLEHRRRHPVLLRWQDDAVLATLPEAERASWRALWADFDAAADRLTPPPLK